GGDKFRIGAEAVAVAEVGELPGGERGAIALPEADSAAAGGVEVVEVAGEIELAVVGDENAIAGGGPDDVVAEVDVVGVVDVDAVGGGLVDRIVDDLVGGGLGAAEADGGDG